MRVVYSQEVASWRQVTKASPPALEVPVLHSLSYMYLLARHVLAWAESDSMNLVSRYIPDPRNVVADQLSRPGQLIGSEWLLHPLLCGSVFQIWGTLVVDLFALALNKKLLVCVLFFPVL